MKSCQEAGCRGRYEKVFRQESRAVMILMNRDLMGNMCSPRLRQEFIPPQDQSRFLITLYTKMGSSTHLRVLIKKNYLTLKRNIGFAITFVVLPILTMAVFLYIKEIYF